MGASVRVIETTAIINGVEQLTGARINATERDSLLFVSTVNQFNKASGRDAKYALLSTCYDCLDNIDLTYEGVAAAKAVYDAESAAYSQAIGAMNAEIAQTTEVACAVRGNWNIDGLVSYVKNLFK